MSSAAVSNPVAPTESKSSRKKKAKAETSKPAAEGNSRSPSFDAGATQAGTDSTTNGAEGGYESPYIKELYKYERK